MTGGKEPGMLRAVGLGMKEKEQSLSLQVRGEAEIAELILALAIKHGVPVVERSGVYGLLSDIQIDEVIPPEYYAVIEGLRSEIQKDLG